MALFREPVDFRHGRASPFKNGVASARLCPAIHVFLGEDLLVRGWDKPGHDDRYGEQQ
jgi:hypothetical protein